MWLIQAIRCTPSTSPPKHQQGKFVLYTLFNKVQAFFFNTFELFWSLSNSAAMSSKSRLEQAKKCVNAAAMLAGQRGPSNVWHIDVSIGCGMHTIYLSTKHQQGKFVYNFQQGSSFFFFFALSGALSDSENSTELFCTVLVLKKKKYFSVTDIFHSHSHEIKNDS